MEVKSWFVLLPSDSVVEEQQGWSRWTSIMGKENKPRIKLIPTSWHSCNPGWPEGLACWTTKHRSSNYAD